MKEYIADYKTDLINAGAILFSFSNSEHTLKILSLLIAIGYTARRWYLMEQNKNLKENDNNG